MVRNAVARDRAVEAASASAYSHCPLSPPPHFALIDGTSTICPHCRLACRDEEVKKERRDKEERDDRKPRGPSSGKQQQQPQEKNKDKPLGGGGGGKSSREKAATLRSPRSKAAEKKP